MIRRLPIPESSPVVQGALALFVIVLLVLFASSLFRGDFGQAGILAGILGALGVVCWVSVRGIRVEPGKQVSGGLVYSSCRLDDAEDVLLHFSDRRGLSIILITTSRVIELPRIGAHLFQTRREIATRTLSRVVVDTPRFILRSLRIRFIGLEGELSIRPLIGSLVRSVSLDDEREFAYDFIRALRQAGFTGDIDDTKAAGSHWL